jgi:hypothetical protein
MNEACGANIPCQDEVKCPYYHFVEVRKKHVQEND